MLTDLLKDEFEPAVRGRALQYASDGSVRRLTITQEYVAATVLGAEAYEVTVEAERNAERWDLLALCTCPYAESAPCKHLWAVLLRAQARLEAEWGPCPPAVRLFIDEEEYVAEVDDDAPAGLPPISNGGRASELPASPRKRPPANPSPQPRKPPAWKRLLDAAPRDYQYRPPAPKPPPAGPLQYVLDAERSRLNGELTIAIMPTPAPGDRAKPKRVPIQPSTVPLLADPQDRAICAMLIGSAIPGRASYYSSAAASRDTPSALWQLSHELAPVVLPMLFDTGRFLWAHREDTPPLPLRAEAQPWELTLVIEPAHKDRRRKASYLLVPALARAEERAEISSFDALFDGRPGLALRAGALAPLHADAPAGAVGWFRAQKPVEIEPGDALPLLHELHKRAIRIPIRWPEDWPVRERADLTPRPRLTLKKPSARHNADTTLEARLSFRYDEDAVAEADGAHYLEHPRNHKDAITTLIRRRPDAEHAAADRLRALGLRPDPYEPSRSTLPAKKLAKLIAPLIDEGWEVRGESGLFRAPGKIDIRVSSGIDWFEVHGEADFGGTTAPIAHLLDALRRGERFVALGDGSQGMLPDDWLGRHAPWLRMGEAHDGSLRFSRAQLSVVDALLAEMPEATCDAQVSDARRRLAAFEGVKPRREPDDFRGELRPYQRLGLGWLHFLDEFGFGGCLADDMGLGKTVQVLAFLAERATPEARAGAGPWLVVAPRSLVFNWIREAARFAPHLRVADYTGQDRNAAQDRLADSDLVVTTYGTLRRDIERLREIDLAGVVLDEAQAIKNPQSQSAKASRLLRARRRLALTGTPVENSLDDLWSIFDFLNPGMLGSASAFALAAKAARTDDGKPDLSLLRRALRPFILRRTKQTVAPELPPRTEQTIPCELAGRQRTIYEGLRKHYRDELLGRVDRDGMNKTRMHVLEALLRLRQAACHPMLIEPKATRSESAKLATLMEMLAEIAAEGNKALVFSQFTSLLDLVQRELEKAGLAYERLDGKTPAAERSRRVDRFQGEGGAPVFLISLKAGGVGLNLTAAQYVFLLDPWWNPAVEAQAIDRTHRIGQDRHVSAYRLIAKGTVEERILELQAAKRELAEAIVAENAGGLKGLSRDDLEWLLS